MSRLLINVGVLTLVSFISACEFSDITAGSDNEKTISFIHMNDLHAHLTPHLDYDYNNGNPKIVKRGGIARLATAIKQIRTDNPNSILMNIGDTYHGGVEALYTRGNAIVDPVNALNIDIGVPGNWDFTYGPSVTRLRYTGKGSNPTGAEVKRVNYPTLAANVTSTTPLDFLPATHTMVIDGVKVGFIGLSSDIVPRMFAGFAIGFDFLTGEQAYIDLVNTLSAQLRKEGSNVVVVMSELGIHKDIDLANNINVNSVDVIFSAHTHELTFQAIVSNSGARIFEAGNDTYLGQLDMQFDNNNQLISTDWQVLRIDDRYKEDPQMAVLVDTARAPFLGNDVNISIDLPGVSQSLTKSIDTVISSSPITLDRRQALESTFNSAFTDTLRQYAGTDIATTPGFRFDSIIAADGYLFEDNTLTAGNVTIEDVYRFFPVTFNLATATVTGARLKSVIEENINAVFSKHAFEHVGGWFDGFSGLDLTLNLSNVSYQVIESLRLEDTLIEIENNKRYTIAGCLRPIEIDESVLCSYSGFENVTTLINPKTNFPLTAIDYLIEQFSLGKFNLSFESHIHDNSETQQWPESEFVQPLSGAK